MGIKSGLSAAGGYCRSNYFDGNQRQQREEGPGGVMENGVPSREFSSGMGRVFAGVGAPFQAATMMSRSSTVSKEMGGSLLAGFDLLLG